MMRVCGILFYFWMVQAHAAPEVKKISFPKQTLVFSNGVSLVVEVAKTDEQRSQGLMFRQNLPDGTGMLFIFPNEMVMSFWMKNTLIPLSIGFFDKARVLDEVLDMSPPLGPVRDDQLSRYQSRKANLYALEVPQGWFTAKKIKPGASFSFKK